MTTDARILKAMREAAPDGVAGTELSRRLGISRAAVWARIEELRGLGYEIEASPHHGYRLLASPDLLHGDDLVSRLEDGAVIGREIQVFRETASTNEIVDKLGRDRVEEGVVVFAESQTGGRGRMGRVWISPPGKGLWFSVLLRPLLRPQELTRLTIASAVALHRAITRFAGIRTEIKWPNDLLIQGRKVAGILTELNAELDRVNYAVLGIGLNVNCETHDWPEALRTKVTSLRIASQRPIERPDLAAGILKELDRAYAALRSDRFNQLAEQWEENCQTLGKHVSIRAGKKCIRGRAESLDPDGALLVRTEHGNLESVIGGDVTLE